jgi:hypothetical protein
MVAGTNLCLGLLFPGPHPSSHVSKPSCNDRDSGPTQAEPGSLASPVANDQYQRWWRATSRTTPTKHTTTPAPCTNPSPAPANQANGPTRSLRIGLTLCQNKQDADPFQNLPHLWRTTLIVDRAEPVFNSGVNPNLGTRKLRTNDVCDPPEEQIEVNQPQGGQIDRDIGRDNFPIP